MLALTGYLSAKGIPLLLSACVQELQALPASLAALSGAVPVTEQKTYPPPLYSQDGLLLHLTHHRSSLCIK